MLEDLLKENEMSNITVLGEDLPDFLQNAPISDLTKSLAGAKSTATKRITHKNGIFRKMVGQEEMGKNKGPLDVIIVNASPAVGRIFYMKAWSPDAEPTAPDCFSNDGRTPDAKAANPQADRCDSCAQNIKGSGQGNSKSCRFSRRLAVALVDDFGTALEGQVYQVNLASKSLFGDSVGENTAPFETYAKYVANNGKSIDWIITRITSNEDNDNQSILFTPVGHINKAQYAITNELGGKEEVKRLVIMTPYQAESSGAKALAAPKATPKVEEESDEFDEPKKRPSTKSVTEAPEVKKNLKSVVKAWSDEE